MNAEKICVIHLNQIGDLVFSLPLLKSLREHFPGSCIHSVVKPYLKELLINSPYIDEIMIRDNGLADMLHLMRTIRFHRYDLLISLSASEGALVLAALSKARLKAGFANFPWDFCLDIKEDMEGHHGWYNNVKLLKRLGIPIQRNDYVGLLKPVSWDQDGKSIVRSAGFNLPERFVIISPGTSARRQVKTWEEKRFAEVIESLHRQYGLSPVLVGGKDNTAMNETIVRILREAKGGKHIDILDVTGKASLTVLCHIIRCASLFVGIDAGIMHLASSLDIPVVGLFGPTDPFYVGPQNRRSMVVRSEGLSCMPCYLKGCKERTCMKELDTPKVLHACAHVLNQTDEKTPQDMSSAERR